MCTILVLVLINPLSTRLDNIVQYTYTISCTCTYKPSVNYTSRMSKLQTSEMPVTDNELDS